MIKNATVEIINTAEATPDQWGRYSLDDIATKTIQVMFIKKQEPFFLNAGGLKSPVGYTDAKIIIYNETSLANLQNLFFKLTIYKNETLTTPEYYKVHSYKQAPKFSKVITAKLIQIEGQEIAAATE